MDGLARFVGDLRQLASVRRIVLDDGAERGVRALAFSTGGGLDFWVLSDRSLDIGPIWWRGAQLGWQSPAGFVAPGLVDADSEGGRGFNRAISGFLVTAGLDHTRQPANGQPLHGRLPFTPARVTACGESFAGDAPVLFVEGEVTQARLGGEALRLRRRIEAPVGGDTLLIRDEVENIGSAPSPQAMLYHFNLGFPVVAPGTTVAVNGKEWIGPVEMPDGDPPETASATRVDDLERVTAAVIAPDGSGTPLTVSFSFDTATLPYLQLWRDLRPRSGILSVEPCTSARLESGLSAAEPVLEPGEKRRYAVAVTVTGTPPPLEVASAEKRATASAASGPGAPRGR